MCRSVVAGLEHRLPACDREPSKVYYDTTPTDIEPVGTGLVMGAT